MEFVLGFIAGGVVGGICFISGIIFSRLPKTRHFISEIENVAQPHGEVFIDESHKLVNKLKNVKEDTYLKDLLDDKK